MEGWVADYFDQNKQRHIKTFERERDAKAWLDTVKFDVKKGVHTPERDSITVAEAAVLWIERAEIEGLETATIRQYRNHVRHHIVTRLGNVRLANLTAPAVERV
jgi:integrase